MSDMPLGTAEIIKADSRDLPLPDNSVDLVVTSPPYFALRSYQDGGEHYAGQVGDEPTPQEFIDSLLEVTRECMRVLKPSGSIWVNLGDKYAVRWASVRDEGRAGLGGPSAGRRRSGANTSGVREKSLMGLPWRYALRCIDELGLILRAEVVWSKPNGLPESVTDRVRRSHEQWFHFTLEPRYFSAVDEIREEHKPGQSSSALSFNREGRGTSPGQSVAPHREGRDDQGLNPLGKLPGSVWTIATEPLKVPAELGIDHFAAFPTEWPRRIINGWAPKGICDECGEGRRPLRGTECSECKAFRPNNANECPGCGHRRDWKADRVVEEAMGATDWSTPGHGTPRHAGNHKNESVLNGYACACPEPTWPTHPAVVLDPFGGTGTTALVAKALGLHGISVDMSSDYCRLAEWRTNDPKQIERVQNMQRYGVRNPTKKQIREFEERAS